MKYKKRTGCPFSFSLDSIGDKWTLLIFREIIIRGKKYYDDFIEMPEGISTNILADRLKDMEGRGFLTKSKDPENKRRYIYQPTEKALDLIPLFIELILWASKYDPHTAVTKEHIENFTKRRAKMIKGWRKPFEV